MIVASVKAVGVSCPELGLMNSLCIPSSYTCGTISVGNIGISCLRVTPLYSAQKTLEFQHDSSTPNLNAIPQKRILYRGLSITSSSRKCKLVLLRWTIFPVSSNSKAMSSFSHPELSESGHSSGRSKRQRSHQISGIHFIPFGDRKVKGGARIRLGLYPNSATVMLNNFLAVR